MSDKRGKTPQPPRRWRTRKLRVSIRRHATACPMSAGTWIALSALILSSTLAVPRAGLAQAGDSVPAEAPEQISVQGSVASEIAPMGLQAAVEFAIANNPSLAEFEAEAQALGAVPSQAGALPDPTFGFNALNMPTDTFDLDQEPMTQMQLTLSQAIPFPGKRRLRREAATYEADAAVTRVNERRLELAANVRAAWWQLFYLERALEIVEQNQALMRDFVQIAQTKYKVGSGLQQDVLLAQLELSRLLNRELRLTGLRESNQAELNALLNRPVSAVVRLPQEPPSAALPDLPAEALLLQRASERRPLLAVQRDLVEAARSRLDLAKKDLSPDFKVAAGYGFRQGNDPLRGGERSDLLSLRFSINVPLYSRAKQRQAVDQRTSELRQQKFSQSDVVLSVHAAISRNLADYLAARQQAVLYGTAIIPQAQQTVSSMLAAYQVNEVDFLNVVTTQITLYNSQIDYWQTLSEAKQALAKVAAAVGEEALYE